MILLFCYRLIFFLLFIVVYPYGRIKAMFGSKIWRERLGDTQNLQSAEIWLHAASVGETKLLNHLIQYIVAKRPNTRLHVTVVTRAGHATALREFGNVATVSYAPIDAHPPVERVFDAIKPKLLVFAETEIWPGLILEASHREVPIVLVNARMSEKSFGWYRALASSLRILLGKYSYFFFRTEEDAARYRYFAVSEAKSSVAGDMKFDAPAKRIDQSVLEKHRKMLGLTSDDFVFVAGSTREGEEQLLLEVFQSLQEKYSNLKLVIAPRHIDRVETIEQEYERAGFHYARYGNASSTDRLLLINQMGLLQELYTLANIAFVGGTLVPIGGHNLLEPVWVGTPVLFGASTENVTSAEEFILSHNYGQKIFSVKELTNALESYYLHRTMFARHTPDLSAANATTRCGDYLLKLLHDD